MMEVPLIPVFLLRFESAAHWTEEGIAGIVWGRCKN